MSIFQGRGAFIRFYEPQILKNYYTSFFDKASLMVSPITVLITPMFL